MWYAGNTPDYMGREVTPSHIFRPKDPEFSVAKYIMPLGDLLKTFL